MILSGFLSAISFCQTGTCTTPNTFGKGFWDTTEESPRVAKMAQTQSKPRNAATEITWKTFASVRESSWPKYFG